MIGRFLSDPASVDAAVAWVGRWRWPEGEVLYFNTVLNRSSEWGVMPFHWYFTSALPRALLGAIVVVALAALRPLYMLACCRVRPVSVQTCVQMVHLAVPAAALLRLAVPLVAFLFLYSLLPHKELRFILLVVPIFNAIAAASLAGLTRRCVHGGGGQWCGNSSGGSVWKCVCVCEWQRGY